MARLPIEHGMHGRTYRFHAAHVPCVETLEELLEVDDHRQPDDGVVGVLSNETAYSLRKADFPIDHLLTLPTRSRKGCWMWRGVLANARTGYWEPVPEPTQEGTLMVNSVITFIGPQELTDVEKNGTPREQQLAKHIRSCWNRIASTELFVAELRDMLHQAVELEAGPDDPNETPKSQEEEDAAIEQFVHRARAVAATTTGKEAFVRWNRMLQAAAIIAAGGKAREYYVEVAREVLSLPAKDTAARGLAKIDIDRAAAAATVVVEPLLFDARYFVSAEPEEAPPVAPAPPLEPPTDPNPPPEETPP